jgi:hypothetical protein
MKNKLTLAVLAVAAISFVACKKERVCECKVDGTTSSKVTLVDVTKRQGKANCISTSQDDGQGGTIKETCELK